jgi:hypothetical protein
MWAMNFSPTRELSDATVSRQTRVAHDPVPDMAVTHTVGTTGGLPSQMLGGSVGLTDTTLNSI